eukprot:gene2430-5370_t
MALPRSHHEFIFDKKLGSGTYGVVYKAHSMKTPTWIVAVKCVSRDRLNKKAEQNVLTECRLLSIIEHPYIVKLFSYEADENFLYLVMEYCSEGDLSHILKEKNHLTEKEAQFFLGQLASALQYLHQRQIAHLDLKPSNLLVYLRGSKEFLKKQPHMLHITSQTREDSFHESLRGSPLYLAPEMLCHKQYDARADLWSVGVILYEVLFGRAPFHSETYLELIKKITDKSDVRIPTHTNISAQCRQLLQRLLQRNPSKRITFDAFFNHPFVDLEHVPSKQSQEKGKLLYVRGRESERQGDLRAALQMYCDAVPYYIAAASFETDVALERKLFKEAEHIIERGEDIKSRLRRNLSLDEDFLATGPPNQDSEWVTSLLKSPDLSVDIKESLQIALEALNQGFAYDLQREYKLATPQYALAIERFLDCVNGKYGPSGALSQKQELFAVIEHFLQRLEALQQQERDTGRSRLTTTRSCVIS